MNLQSAGKAAGEMTRLFLNQPRLGFRRLRNLLRPFSGFLYPRDEKTFSTKQAPDCPADQAAASNPLIDYFESHHEGRGIWKWVHYFYIYHRHFSKYVGREVHIVEIGVYSGGSLDLWKHYFGPRCRVYGVDIKESCKDYEDETTRIFIGNQGDRRFWKRFKSEVPHVDILVDDGGHHTDHQIVTLEEMLPHLRPGGSMFVKT